MILTCKRKCFVVEKNLREVYDVFVWFNNKFY